MANTLNIAAIRKAIEAQEDVKTVHRLEPINGGLLYLIETPFKTFPRFVVGTTDFSLSEVHPMLKCGERWTADDAFERFFNSSRGTREERPVVIAGTAAEMGFGSSGHCVQEVMNEGGAL